MASPKKPAMEAGVVHRSAIAAVSSDLILSHAIACLSHILAADKAQGCCPTSCVQGPSPALKLITSYDLQTHVCSG